MLSTFFILLISILLLSVAVDTVRLGISPMPSSKRAKQAILSIPKNGLIYELGSGWGNLAFALAEKYPIRCFECAFLPWIFSSLLKVIRRRKNISIERKNFFSENLSKADVVVCYLYPGAMEKLKDKFENELKSGALVISNSFQIPGKKPDHVIEVNDWMHCNIYCYQFPFKESDLR
ncbi:MAG: SAM-dependent methyltransferase [Chlamydiae bacterium CG10_big_fil_rev_8_21_14_0_10_42_34]|nr:MAG: SAM-dependent methyltransferase [Chlamydiae bacterium CG10_big_fil_rev_8_21_14_0_10_42_34]